MDKKTCCSIGERLKAMRLRKGLTLEDVGRSIGFHKSTIMRWEKGDTSNIKLPIMESLAQLYGTTPEYLMGWNDMAVPSNVYHYSTATLPVIKKMRAFSNEYSHSSYDGLADVPDDLLDEDSKYFLFKITDESMSPKFMVNDILLIMMQKNVRSGEIALVSLGSDEGIVRRIIHTNDSITLVCENGNYIPQSFYGDDRFKVRIYGKAVKLIRDIEQDV